MNYAIFRQMQEGVYAKGSGETEQAYMERIFRAACEGGTQNLNEASCLNDLVIPEFVCCSAEEKTLCLRFQPRPWQLNPIGTLHGGMIATAIDITFGMLSRYYTQSSRVVTVELDVNYMRAIQKEDTYLVRVKATKVGRQVKFLDADVLIQDTRKQAAKATAVFM